MRLEFGNNAVIDAVGPTDLELLTIDIPGMWTGFVVGEGDGTATVRMECENLYDPTNAFAYQIRLQNSRSS